MTAENDRAALLNMLGERSAKLALLSPFLHLFCFFAKILFEL